MKAFLVPLTLFMLSELLKVLAFESPSHESLSNPPQSIGQTLANNIPGILTGVAAILTAILTAVLTYMQSRRGQKKLEGEQRKLEGEQSKLEGEQSKLEGEQSKLEGSKVGRGEDLAGAITSLIRENREFQLLFRNQLLEQGSIEAIKRLGEFVSKPDINDFVARPDINNLMEDCVRRMLVTPAVLNIIVKQAELLTHTDIKQAEFATHADLRDVQTKLFALDIELHEKAQDKKKEAKKFQDELKRAKRKK